MMFKFSRLSALMLLVGLFATCDFAEADGHYAHEHVIHSMPHERFEVRSGNDHLYFSHGYWYRGHGPDFIAIAPPFGLRVSVLPWGYQTLVFGGLTYFVLNDVWYQQLGAEYVVVAPPAGAQVSAAVPAPVDSVASDNFFIYPKSGQSEQQQATDKYECHSWAKQQTSFDPTQPLGGVTESAYRDKRNDYRRAISACLEGRGYTVR